MDIKQLVLAAGAFVLADFVLGFTWRRVLFKRGYAEFGAYGRRRGSTPAPGGRR